MRNEPKLSTAVIPLATRPLPLATPLWHLGPAVRGRAATGLCDMSEVDTDIIVPVFNEADGLERFHKRLTATGVEANLVFVDNASTDNSVEIIKSFPGVTLIEHEKNEGYGGSLIDGMSQTTGSRIVIIDADCEFPPECVPDLIASLEENEVTYASRLLGKKTAADANMPSLKMFGNKFISSLFNVLFGQKTTDLYTGCKAMRRSCVEQMDFEYKGYEHVLELGARLAHRGYAIREIPVDFEARETGTSKMKHVSETTKFMLLIFAFFFRSKMKKL
jgi:dolichol-phosphate mannosyltransferase